MGKILKADKDRKYRNERKRAGTGRSAGMAAALLLAMLFALSAAGCKGQTAEETSPAQETVSPSTENSQEGRSPSSENSQERTSPSSENGQERTSLSSENGQEGTSLPTEIKAPNYRFTAENFPRMDGSTAAVPMGKAVAQFLLGCSEEQAESMCSFNRTTQSFRNLMNDQCDILLVGEPNAAVFTEMEEEGFAYELEDIATDALVFVVNESNPVDDLTTEQIRDIYSGKITNWKEVGGADAPIKAFQRNEGAGSQALIKKLIMKDTPMTEAPQEEIISSMGELMSAVKNFDNSANALGYSVYYYANDMKMARGLKILRVDGVEPNPETIRSKAYPHRNAYYCVIPGEPVNEDEQAAQRSASARVIYDWLVTQDGQDLLASIGYVSIQKPRQTASAEKETVEELYTTASGKKVGEIGELKAGDSYGKLIPYIGDRIRTGDEEYGYEGENGFLYGFLDEKGRIVSDAVYTELSRMGYLDPKVISGSDVDLPMYRVSNTIKRAEGTAEGEEEYASARYRLISEDGSFISEKDYAYVRGFENGILCLDKYDSKAMEYIALDGKLLFTEKEVLEAAGKTLNEATLSGIVWNEFGYLGEGFYQLGTTNGSFILDEALNVLAGPYSYVNQPVNGRMQVSLMHEGDDREMGQVLDEQLKPVIEEELTYADILKNGNILMLDYYRQRAALYSHDGVLLKDFDGATYALGTVFGFVISVPCGSDSSQQCYNFDGELLSVSLSANTPMADAMVPVLGLRGVKEEGKAFRAMDYADSTGVMLYQLETGDLRYLEGYNYIGPLYTQNGREEVQFMESIQYDGKTGESKVIVIGRDLKTALEGSGSIEALYDANEHKTYFVFHRVNETEKDEVLLDDQMNVLVENLHGEIRVCSGYVFATDNQKTEGRKIGEDVSFRYLLASAGDD